MKRRHLRAHTIEFCEEVRRLRPDAAFGADLIAGFPTETDEMAANTRRLVEEAGLTYLHVFPFSPREGTPAARMPQLPRETVKARASALREVGEAALAAHFAKLQGSRQELLVEQPGMGRTKCFAPVRFDPADFEAGGEAGSFTHLRITGARDKHLIGSL
jgi:threonylcarbamoyladenosine tRNA methylthiotransferase MtaB